MARLSDKVNIHRSYLQTVLYSVIATVMLRQRGSQVWFDGGLALLASTTLLFIKLS